MRRIQIYIEEELDDRLSAEASKTGRSKAALIRESVAERFGDAVRRREPLDALVGSVDAEPAEVDDVVYGR
jgi:predicted transcriptional regulator